MRRFIATLILFVFPSILFPTSFDIPKPTQFHLPGTYDEMLQFFDDLESGALEKRCSDADLHEITEYIVHLSIVGTFPEDDHLAMHADIANLLSPSAFIYADPLKEDYRFTYCDASTSEYELC